MGFRTTIILAGPGSVRLARFWKQAVLVPLLAGMLFVSACSAGPTPSQQPPIATVEAPTATDEGQVASETLPTLPTVETAPTATVEAEEAEPEESPAAATQPVMEMPLPRGVVPEPTELSYGPKHPSMVLLPAGTQFVLLGKNRGEEKLKEGTWFRVQIYDGPEVGRVGWLKAEMTRPETLAANTNAIPSPPSCAKALANSLDDFQEADRSLSTMGVWRSTNTGDTAFVIDIYRRTAGELSPELTFILEANGRRVALPEEIKPTRKSFIWRGLVVHADLNRSDTVRFVLQAAGGPIPDEISWFVSVYSAPEGCEFNQ